MASIINASTAGVGGVITTADNTGILNIQTAGTTALTIDSAQLITVAGAIGIGVAPDGTQHLHIGAGTATKAPLELTTGTLMTTADGGSIEYDGTAFYSSIAASSRGVMPSEQLVILTGTNTLTSQTAAQPLFDGGGGTTNGAVTLPIGTYQFECFYSLSGMSATTGTFGFALGGTATKTQSWTSQAIKSVSPLTSTGTLQTTYSTIANTSLTTTSTQTVGHATIKGIIRVTVAGTVIPQVSLTVAAAAIVGINSYFKISPLGNATVATVGNWS